MFKSVKLKNADTCLTFVLKRLNILSKYKNINGCEFASKFKMKLIDNFSKLSIGDIIVVKKKEEIIYVLSNEIDAKGKIFSNNVNRSYHFMLFEGNFISDYDGDEDIRCYKLDYFNLDDEAVEYYRISKKQLRSA